MDSEKTLLQQIRDKEQELAQDIEAARAEGEALVTAARTEAEDLLCAADSQAKVAAEQVYWKERGRTGAEISQIREAAALDGETVARQGEQNRAAAAERIVRYVTMD